MSDIPVLGSKVVSGVDPTEFKQLNISILLLLLYLGSPKRHSDTEPLLFYNKPKVFVVVSTFW